MSKKRCYSMVPFVAVLLLLAIVSSGGCGGSGGGDGNNEYNGKIAVLGSMPSEFEEAFFEWGFPLQTFDKERAADTPRVMITKGGLAEIRDDDEAKAALREIFTFGDGKSGHVVLFEPDNEMVDEVENILGVHFGVDLYEEDPVLFYGIEIKTNDELRLYIEFDPFDPDSVIEEGILDRYDGELPDITSEDLIASGDQTASEDIVPTMEAYPEPDIEPLNGVMQGLIDWLFIPSDSSGGEEPDDPVIIKAASPLTDLAGQAMSFQVQLNDNSGGKSFSINQYIVSAHHFDANGGADGGRDLYYMTQSSALDGSGGVRKFFNGPTIWLAGKAYDLPGGESYVIGDMTGTAYLASSNPAKNPCLVTSVVSPDIKFRAYGTIMDNIIKSYRIDNTLTVGSSGSLSDVVLDNASPVQAIGVTTVTASQQIQHSEETSASFSISGKTPGVSIGQKVTDGYSFGRSETYNVLDVELRQSSDVGKKSISWQYDIKMPKFADKSARLYRILTDGALLGTSMFNPWQMWSWSIPTKERNNIGKFDIALTVTRAFVYASDYEEARDGHAVTGTHTKSISVTLPQPPLLAASTQSVNTDKAENVVSVKIAAQGNWTAASTDSGDWFSIARQNDMLHVTFKENTTGGNRSGQISVSRDGTSDKIDISVLQFGVSQK